MSAARLSVLALVLALGACTPDDGTTTPDDASATSDGGTTTSEEAATGDGTPEAGPLVVPEKGAGELARDVVYADSGESESTLFDATSEGEPLQLVTACGPGPGRATISLLDARDADDVPAIEDRTLAEVSVECDGTEHRNDIASGTGFPMQVTSRIEGEVELSYALLVPAEG